MFSDMLAALADMTNTTPSAIILMSLLCIVGAIMTKDSVSNPNFAFLIYPVLVAGSIFSAYLLSLGGFFDPNTMAGWLMTTFFATGLGMVFGLGTFIVMQRSLGALVERGT